MGALPATPGGGQPKATELKGSIMTCWKRHWRWEFAIFKYSDERYDPDEWMFPGGEELDGTIEGAMRAGLKAYP
jgi:hypothetical protein